MKRKRYRTTWKHQRDLFIYLLLIDGHSPTELSRISGLSLTTITRVFEEKTGKSYHEGIKKYKKILDKEIMIV